MLHSTLGFLEARHHRPRHLAAGPETVERRSEASLQVVCHRSTRCARRRARRPVHSTRALPPRTAPAAKHISSQARDRIAPLTLTWRSSSLYAQLNGRNSRKMPKKSKNKTGAARDALAANKRARRAADEPHTADTPSPCEQLMARLNDASVRCAIDDVNVPSSSAGQPAPVEVLQTLLAASDRAADARHPRDAKHGQGRDARPVGRSHLSRTEHL